MGPSVGDVVGGKYHLARLIGQGGMGTVYEAQDLKLGRSVAVKFLQQRVAHDFGLVERFMREAKATAAIAHPRIVDVFDVGWTDDGELPYFVMELLDGRNLTSELRISGPMSVDRAVGLVLQVLDALEAAHGHGFIHRDLKPENIFVIRHGLEEEVKVLDFGVTKAIGGNDTSLTHTGAVLGTPAYMSPEQARGSREIDLRTDVYASAAILYELIAGRPPYEGETYNEIIIKIATEDPPTLQSLRPGVHPALAAVIQKALSRDPDKRWPSCAAMSQALHEALDDVHTSTGILADPEASFDTTHSTLKPTPTAWEVTAPSPRAVPLGSAPVDDADPEERTQAIAGKLPSNPDLRRDLEIRVDPEATDAVLIAPEHTTPLPVLETEPARRRLSAATGRTQTVAFLAVVGLLTGAATYVIGGWLIDEDATGRTSRRALPPLDLEPPPPPPLPRPAGWNDAPGVGLGVPGRTPPDVTPEAAPTPIEPRADEAETTPPSAPPSHPEPSCRIRATVETPDARIILDGSRADPEIDLPSPCGSTHVLQVAAPGFTSARVQLTASTRPEARRVELRRAGPRGTTRPGPRRPRRPGHGLEPNPF